MYRRVAAVLLPRGENLCAFLAVSGTAFTPVEALKHTTDRRWAPARRTGYSSVSLQDQHMTSLLSCNDSICL